jgi:hypothetical protein
MRHREAEARAAGLRRGERLEQPLAHVGGDARAQVGHHDLEATAVEGDALRQLRLLHRPGGDAHCGAVGRHLQRVEHEIEERAVQQVLVAVEAQRFLGHAHVDADAVRLARVREGERGRGLRDLPEVHRLHLRDAHAGKIEELGEQARESVGFAQHQVAQRALVVGDGGPPRHQLDGAADGCQRILDFVRERGREFGHRLQPLRAQVELFEPLLVADVMEDRRRHAWDVATVARAGSRRHAHGEGLSPLREQPLGATEVHMLAQRTVEGIPHHRRHASEVVEHHHADRRLERQAQQLAGHRVGILQHAVLVERDDGAADVRQDVGGAQPYARQLGLQALGALPALAQARRDGAGAEGDRHEDGELEQQRDVQHTVGHHDHVGHVEDAAEAGDEQRAPRRQENRRRGIDEDVERGEARCRTLGDVHHRGHDEQVENELPVQEADRGRLPLQLRPDRRRDHNDQRQRKGERGDQRLFGIGDLPDEDGGDVDRGGQRQARHVEPPQHPSRLQNREESLVCSFEEVRTHGLPGAAALQDART